MPLMLCVCCKDGIETYSGDPVKAAKSLASDAIETVVDIIGFDVDNVGNGRKGIK
ncbi:hypothetical protein K0H71_14805 [Bacillus sp. IITD106]|nr:hypothetical protein [Bacillus sp. IITD106]